MAAASCTRCARDDDANARMETTEAGLIDATVGLDASAIGFEDWKPGCETETLGRHMYVQPQPHILGV